MVIRMIICFAFFFSSSTFTHAEQKKITIYSDGVSCPANCDAHVVFDKRMNGTEFAYKPNTQYEPCKPNSECRICLESGGKQCLNVMYRGPGPHKNTFDFTPAFYIQACGKNPMQRVLLEMCSSMQKSASRLNTRINCIQNPSKDVCVNIMMSANKEKTKDTEKYKQCLTQGETSYNRGVTKVDMRSEKCAYERYGTGKNSDGKTWRKLLPAACRNNTYVGRDGLDCCSGNTLTDGPLAHECAIYYPK
ncbi:hypothetical protein [Pantoea sp. AS-PWVM4]|uniref:hypothetical protein n=1 Tax=Pantoea sp. AS-PWVM4 TaxID=1332069 RepID=UPI0012698338|nr:hypothetical protein [Pantoea sp. AS-PWVM4]